MWQACYVRHEQKLAYKIVKAKHKPYAITSIVGGGSLDDESILSKLNHAVH